MNEPNSHSPKTMYLVLEDGTIFQGISFGYESPVAGEVVFSTGMVGYPESLSDPSYLGQILTLTYPLIGNYGVPKMQIKDGLAVAHESEKIQVAGLVVSEASETYSHWNAHESLSAWLKANRVPAICGIDTRALTKKVREKGTMLGKLIFTTDEKDAQNISFKNPDDENLVALASCKEVIHYGSGKYKIVLVDCGVKHNIIRNLLQRDTSVIRVPWDYDFNTLEYDALFISNGPGDPNYCQITAQHIQQAMQKDKPIFGICMGNQLLSIASGAKIYKLKYGHRSCNQPVLLAGTKRAFITSQNHGFAVDNDTLGSAWQPLFLNMNDGTNEGIYHTEKPWFSAQFHPEANAGPTDARLLFDVLMRVIKAHKKGSDFAQKNIISYIEEELLSRTTNAHNPYIPDRAQIKKVLVLGSGALKIGEAGEFDYSGSQALKALREEGIETILINPNIATVQTSKGIADKVYFLPLTPEFVERVIAKERPQGIFLSVGGQTALNCGVALYRNKIFEKYAVQVLGTPIQAVIDTEDREIFNQKLAEIDVKYIHSEAVTNLEDARKAASTLGYPVIARAAYALGGMGSGFCENDEELCALVEKSFAHSPQVLIEKSLKGWKEIEYEVVRDRYDNCITVCNMENFDPLGIHTGESIVVAPSQTLSNSEYYKLRELAIRIIRHIGIVGECNVQYALDPHSEDYRVIEVNARLSRSSALASKATGYPLAFVAAKLGLGYGLSELKNAITKVTSAFFEPALDYVVCKIPRWDLGKFQGVSHALGSSMKSVGEIMAIGRSFEEVIQKGLRMTGVGMHGFVANKFLSASGESNHLGNQKSNFENELSNKVTTENGLHKQIKNELNDKQESNFESGLSKKVTNENKLNKQIKNELNDKQESNFENGSSNKITNENKLNKQIKNELNDKQESNFENGLSRKVTNENKLNDKEKNDLEQKLSQPTDKRIFYISEALQKNYAVETLHALTKIDLWFLHKLARIVAINKKLSAHNTLIDLPDELLWEAKRAGFSDFQITRSVCKCSAQDMDDAIKHTRAHRKNRGVLPVVKQIDTLSAEYPAQTNYLYITYHGTENDLHYAQDKRSVIVLGSGAYRIGSSVEFDWCSVNAINTIREAGARAVMINYNPETVSTDYDVCDHLYFDELSFERVMDVVEMEMPRGVIVSVGGQIPNNLALKLAHAKVPILGTQAQYIDLAEDRHKFSSMLDALEIDQPRWKELSSFEDVHAFAQNIGFPVLVRPSYVLSGAAMNVCYNAGQLENFLHLASDVSKKHPVVVSEFLKRCKEIEVDAVAREGEIIMYAISEHIEFAGVHSGDATLQFPAQRVYIETIRQIKNIAHKIARALQISGPFNIQFLARDSEIKVIECNLRASRSFPFVSKVLKINFIELATKIMLGIPVEKPEHAAFDLDYVGIKASQFSFARLQNADPVLGVDMASTGEVGCLGDTFLEAVLTALLSVGYRVPAGKIMISSGATKSKVDLLDACKLLVKKGYALYATRGTQQFLAQSGVPATAVLWPDEEGALNVRDMLMRKEFDFVINIPKDTSVREMKNDYLIRRTAIDFNIPLITDARLASAFIQAFCTLRTADIPIKSWDEY